MSIAQKCKIEGCKGLGGMSKKYNRRFYYRGYCTAHYQRFLKYGDASKILYPQYGNTKKPLYGLYRSMIARCYNEKNTSYKNYGARGIKVCDRWLDNEHGLDNFLQDMGERPSKMYWLDRIDVNGDYSPGNCQWATIHHQQANKRNSNKVTGVYKRFNKWIAKASINGIIYRETFNTAEEAIKKRKQWEKEIQCIYTK